MLHMPVQLSNFLGGAWVILSKPSKKKLATTNSLYVFGGFFCPPLARHTNQTQYQENAGKINIWGPYFIPKSKGLDGG